MQIQSRADENFQSIFFCCRDLKPENLLIDDKGYLKVTWHHFVLVFLLRALKTSTPDPQIDVTSR